MEIDHEMREWLLDCFGDDYDQEQIQELTSDELVTAINRYYHGGMKEFVKSLTLTSGN